MTDRERIIVANLLQLAADGDDDSAPGLHWAEHRIGNLAWSAYYAVNDSKTDMASRRACLLAAARNVREGKWP